MPEFSSAHCWKYNMLQAVQVKVNHSLTMHAVVDTNLCCQGRADASLLHHCQHHCQHLTLIDLCFRQWSDNAIVGQCYCRTMPLAADLAVNARCSSFTILQIRDTF
jgi:hypothetical protein